MRPAISCSLAEACWPCTTFEPGRVSSEALRAAHSNRHVTTTMYLRRLPMGTPPITVLIGKFERDMNERDVVVRPTSRRAGEMECAAALRQGVFVKRVAEALGNSVDVQPSGSFENSIAPQFSRATRPASMRTTVSDGLDSRVFANSDTVRLCSRCAYGCGNKAAGCFSRR